jgi:hypothetical protein
MIIFIFHPGEEPVYEINILYFINPVGNFWYFLDRLFGEYILSRISEWYGLVS